MQFNLNTEDTEIVRLEADSKVIKELKIRAAKWRRDRNPSLSFVRSCSPKHCYRGIRATVAAYVVYMLMKNLVDTLPTEEMENDSTVSEEQGKATPEVDKG